MHEKNLVLLKISCGKYIGLIYVLLFFCPFLFSDKRQATETEKEGEILQRTQKKRMERCYEQIKIIVILAITFDLRFLHMTVTQTLLHGSSLLHEILISVLWEK